MRPDFRERSREPSDPRWHLVPIGIVLAVIALVVLVESIDKPASALDSLVAPTLDEVPAAA